MLLVRNNRTCAQMKFNVCTVTHRNRDFLAQLGSNPHFSPPALSFSFSLAISRPHFTRTQSAVTDSSSQQADVILSKGKTILTSLALALGLCHLKG